MRCTLGSLEGTRCGEGRKGEGAQSEWSTSLPSLPHTASHPVLTQPHTLSHTASHPILHSLTPASHSLTPCPLDPLDSPHAPLDLPRASPHHIWNIHTYATPLKHEHANSQTPTFASTLHICEHPAHSRAPCTYVSALHMRAPPTCACLPPAPCPNLCLSAPCPCPNP